MTWQTVSMIFLIFLSLQSVAIVFLIKTSKEYMEEENKLQGCIYFLFIHSIYSAIYDEEIVFCKDTSNKIFIGYNVIRQRLLEEDQEKIEYMLNNFLIKEHGEREEL